jgi:hypothetical protein
VDVSIDLIEGLLLGAISGLVGWVWFLHNKVTEVQIDLAKNYHSKEELRNTVQEALFPIQRELERLSRVIERLQDNDR